AEVAGRAVDDWFRANRVAAQRAPAVLAHCMIHGAPGDARRSPYQSVEAPAHACIHAAAFTGRRARHVLAGIVVTGGDGGGVMAVSDVAHLRPQLPAAARCVVTNATAEDDVAVRPIAVGVVHRDA